MHPFYLNEPLVVCICAELKLPVPTAGSSCVLEGKWTETELLVAWLQVLGDIICCHVGRQTQGVFAGADDSVSLCITIAMPFMFISSSLSIDMAHKGTHNHSVPECCCCHTQPRLTVLLLIIKAIKGKTLFTAVITTMWFISPRWLYPAGLLPAFSHIYIKQASFSENLCFQAAGRITAKNIFMTSGSSSCTSCTNQAEEMQKGADDKGSLCCLGHKETQWGSEWAADFYHSGSLSFSLTVTFAVTSSKNKLLLNYSCVNLQN